jgi:hypothetical protein
MRIVGSTLTLAADLLDSCHHGSSTGTKRRFQLFTMAPQSLNLSGRLHVQLMIGAG